MLHWFYYSKFLAHSPITRIAEIDLDSNTCTLFSISVKSVRLVHCQFVSILTSRQDVEMESAECGSAVMYCNSQKIAIGFCRE